MSNTCYHINTIDEPPRCLDCKNYICAGCNRIEIEPTGLCLDCCELEYRDWPNNRNITHQKLINNGYKFQLYSVGPIGSYSKTIYKDRKKAYFIIIFRYSSVFAHEDFDLDVRLYRENQQFSLNLRIEKNTTIEEIEKFYEEAYEKFNCIPDIHNNN